MTSVVGRIANQFMPRHFDRVLSGQIDFTADAPTSRIKSGNFG
ncbi:hypothetical protein [Neorhodopirellula pilleata]|nr:hypothetical protein [Neorhodopirellula pilleata]